MMVKTFWTYSAVSKLLRRQDNSSTFLPGYTTVKTNTYPSLIQVKLSQRSILTIFLDVSRLTIRGIVLHFAILIHDASKQQDLSAVLASSFVNSTESGYLWERG